MVYQHIHMMFYIWLSLSQPMHHQGNLIPDLQADYQLFDRVVNVSANNAVPFGLRGTITGILGGVCGVVHVVVVVV